MQFSKKLVFLTIIIIIVLTIFFYKGLNDNKDSDVDGIRNKDDNCKDNKNPEQNDIDQDGKGDACDINLYIRGMIFDPVNEKISLDERLLTKENTGYYLIQFNYETEEEVVNNLKSRGVELLGLLSTNGFLIKTDLDKNELNSIKGVRFVDIYQPIYKLAPDLYKEFTKGNLNNESENLTIDISVFNNINNIEKEISSIGGNFSRLYSSEDIHYDKELVLEIKETKLRDIAFIKEIKSIRIHTPEILRMNTATIITEVRKSAAEPNILGLTGLGQIIGVRDSGLDTGDYNTLHPDIKGRVIKVIDNWSDKDGHGTHVVGIIAGDGSASGGFNIRGVAPKSKIAFRSSSVAASISEILTSSHKLGAKIFSNSWGWDDNSTYDEREEELDDFINKNPETLVLFASTNIGPTIGLGTPDVSKNALIVGASENNKTLPNPQAIGPYPNNLFFPISRAFGGTFYQSGVNISSITSEADNKDDWSGFTGIGPTSDRRIKPDVVAPGTWILATRSAVCNPKDKSWPADASIEDVEGDGLINHGYRIGSGLESGPIYGYGGGYDKINVIDNPTGNVLLNNFKLRNIAADKNNLINGVAASSGLPAASLSLNAIAIPSNPILPPVGGGAIQSLYYYLSGASMSTPHVAGIAALIREYLQKNRNIPNPSGMLLKAFIINGAVDMDNSRNTGAIPDTREGWGRANIVSSIAPEELIYRVDFRDWQTLNKTFETINITDLRFSANKPVQITLTWYDLPSAVGGGALINDLNLELRFPSNKLYRGGARSMINGETINAIEDNINNVEKIILKVAEDGFYNISIFARNIRLGRTQSFAIVYSQLYGIDSARINNEYKHKFFSEDVYARGIGLVPKEHVNIYIVNNTKFDNGLKLDDVSGWYEEVIVDDYGNISAKDSKIIWKAPTNWIYSGNGDGNYNIVIDRGLKNSILNNSEDLVDYYNKSGFKVVGVSASNAEEEIKKTFTSSDDAVYVKSKGLENGSSVSIHLTKDVADNLDKSIIKRLTNADENGTFNYKLLTSPSNFIYYNTNNGKYSIKIDVDLNDSFSKYYDAIDKVIVDNIIDFVNKGNSIKFGDNSEAVMQLQYLINAYGFNIKVNGIFDKTTEDKLNEYLMSRGLASDGNVNSNDILKIVEDADTSFKVMAATAIDKEGIITKVFNKNEFIGVKGAGFIRNINISVYLIKHIDQITDNYVLVDESDDGVNKIKTDNNGLFTIQNIWGKTSPDSGKYDIIIDRNNNGIFDIGIDTKDMINLFALQEVVGNKLIEDNNAIIELKTFLRIFVDPMLEVNNKFDDKTKTTLINYQKSNGLEETGFVNEETFSVMKEEAIVSLSIQNIQSSDETSLDKDIFTVSEDKTESIYGFGSGFAKNKDVRLYIIKNVELKDGDKLIDESGEYEKTTTNENGEIENILLWENVNKNNIGSYRIIVDVNNDDIYTNKNSMKDIIQRNSFEITGNKPLLCNKDEIIKDFTYEKWDMLTSQNIPFLCEMKAVDIYDITPDGKEGRYEEVSITNFYIKGNSSREELLINNKLIRLEIIKDGEHYEYYRPIIPEEERDSEISDCIWLRTIDGSLPRQLEPATMSEGTNTKVICKCTNFDINNMFSTSGKICDK